MTKKSFAFRVALVSLAAVLLAGIGVLTLGRAVRAKAETAAENLTVNAKSALLMDYSSGKVVFTQNDTEHLPIASMVKIMTLLLCFEEIDAGNLTIDDEITASGNATSMGGSQAFLDTNSMYKTDELLKSIVVASANDSCVAMAEHIAGSVELFVDRMNEKAKALGMDNTNFVNCTGLPAPNQYSCASDVGKMTRALLGHTDFYKYSTVWMFDFKHPSGRITQLSNTNKLLRGYEGCDGGKTGFTNEAMFCLSATAKRGNTRLISVVMGAKTSKERNAENAKLFNYGFANYETKQLVVKGVGDGKDYDVKSGKIKSVKLVPQEDFYYFKKKNESGEVEFENRVPELKAPLAEGQAVGELVVKIGGAEVGSVPLCSDTAVKKVAYLDVVDGMISEW